VGVTGDSNGEVHLCTSTDVMVFNGVAGSNPVTIAAGQAFVSGLTVDPTTVPLLNTVAGHVFRRRRHQQRPRPVDRTDPAARAVAVGRSGRGRTRAAYAPSAVGREPGTQFGLVTYLDGSVQRTCRRQKAIVRY
jgi:hypothetical protein